MPTKTNDLLYRQGDPDFMTSLARGLEVLKSFSLGNGRLTAAEIGKQTGLSRAVVRRCLYTLAQTGYVRKVQDHYQLEAQVISLARPFWSTGNSLPAVAQPLLEAVSDQVHESCSIAIRDGSDVIYIARAATSRIMTVALQVGSRLPAAYTSLGRVLLTTLTAKQLDNFLKHAQLKSHTKHSITSKRELREIVAHVRESGYALVDEELEIGLRSIAVPVYDNQEQMVCAMNVGVQATRISVADLSKRILPVLQDAASQLGVLAASLNHTQSS